MDGYVWSGYFGRDDCSGGGVAAGRLEKTTAEKRHLRRLVWARTRAIEMEWDAARAGTVRMADGWPFLVCRNERRFGIKQHLW